MSFDLEDSDGDTPLHLAVMKDYPELVELMLAILEDASSASIGIFLNRQNSNGETALHLAIPYWPQPLISSLWSDREGVSFGLQDYRGNTPLHVAVTSDCLELIQHMVNQGSPNVTHHKNIHGETALQMAIRCGKWEIFNFLFGRQQGGLNIEIEDNDGNSLLHLAALGGCLQIVQDLTPHCAGFINSQNKNGETALHLALNHCRTRITRFLLEQEGIDFEIKDLHGETPLLCAIQAGCWHIVQHLVERCNATKFINHQNHDGETALHNAIRLGYVDTAGLLVQHGANMDLKDMQGRIPLMIAAENNDRESVQLLVVAMMG